LSRIPRQYEPDERRIVEALELLFALALGLLSRHRRLIGPELLQTDRGLIGNGAEQPLRILEAHHRMRLPGDGQHTGHVTGDDQRATRLS
jgi:hypothetical protein